MKKEVIIVVTILILIIITDIFTQDYTKNSFKNIKLKLNEISDIGKNLDENKNIDVEKENIKLEEKIETLNKEWQNINKKVAIFIEHDELEKVNVSMVKLKNYFEVKEYGEAIPELENCKYILEHIVEKQKIKLINLF